MKLKSTFLLFIFLFLKVGIAHSISHELSINDHEECEQCVLLLDANKTQSLDCLETSTNNKPFNEEVLLKPIHLGYQNPIIKENYYSYLFNKPPPHIKN